MSKRRKAAKEIEPPCSLAEVARGLTETTSYEIVAKGGDSRYLEIALKKDGDIIALVLVNSRRKELTTARVRCDNGWLILGLVPARSRDSVPYIDFGWLYIDENGLRPQVTLRSDESNILTKALSSTVENVLRKLV
ncbi:MAG: hypothetical protein DRO12_03660 [Thermoprotei archaeon]|nr:MAG: hypothetical protein DRO12_03660 [Thermoprotei archaeon]